MPSLDHDELKDLEGWIIHILSVGYSPKQVKEFLERKGVDGSDVDLVLRAVLEKMASKQVSKVSGVASEVVSEPVSEVLNMTSNDSKTSVVDDPKLFKAPLSQKTVSDSIIKKLDAYTCELHV